MRPSKRGGCSQAGPTLLLHPQEQWLWFPHHLLNDASPSQASALVQMVDGDGGI